MGLMITRRSHLSAFCECLKKSPCRPISIVRLHIYLELLQSSGTRKVDRSLETGNVLVVVAVYIRDNIVCSLIKRNISVESPRQKKRRATNRGNCRRQVNRFGDCYLARLQRAAQVDVGGLFAKVGRGRNKLNQAILDGEFDIGALCDILLNIPRQGD